MEKKVYWARVELEPLHFEKMAKPVKHCIGTTSETFVSQQKLSFLDIAPAKSKGTTRTLSKKRYSALGIFNAKSNTVTGTRICTSTQIGTVNHISYPFDDLVGQPAPLHLSPPKFPIGGLGTTASPKYKAQLFIYYAINESCCNTLL